MYQRRGKSEAAKGNRPPLCASVSMNQPAQVKDKARAQNVMLKRSLRLWKKRSKLAHSSSSKEVVVIDAK